MKFVRVRRGGRDRDWLRIRRGKRRQHRLAAFAIRQMRLESFGRSAVQRAIGPRRERFGIRTAI